MQTHIPLEPGHYYHIYNRGNNRENIFFEERNYRYFMLLYQKYILPTCDTFAYCLMRNHFHLLVRVREIYSQTSEVFNYSSKGSAFQGVIPCPISTASPAPSS